jgi:multicomponent Na+:H+ antiporter subunit D
MNNLVIWPFVLPVITALVCLFGGRVALWRRWAVACSAMVQVALAFYLQACTLNGPPMVQVLGGWSAHLGVALVIDGLAAIMLCLSTLVALVCILYSFFELDVEHGHPLRLPLTQLLVAGINLSFITGDLFNMFVAFEIMLVASYALLTLEANDRHIKEAFPYLIVNIFGSTIFLISAGMAYAVFGTLNLAQISERAAEMEGSFAVALVAVMLMVVFGIKAGVFPLYYWLPNSYPILPYSLAALYSGMLTKVGIYVLLRMLCTVFPHSLDRVHIVLGWLAGLTMVLAVLGAISRNFVRGILSFHIASQIGYMLLAIGLFTPLAIAACIFYVIHHIIVKSSLFLIGGIAFFRNGTDHLERMGGLWKTAPVLGVLFMLQAFSLAGIPPLSGFWGKFTIVAESLRVEQYWLAIAALVASILTMVSMMKIWLQAFWRPSASSVPLENTHTLTTGSFVGMTGIVGVMVVMSLFIGLNAESFLRVSTHTADALLDPTIYRSAVLSIIGKGGAP